MVINHENPLINHKNLLNNHENQLISEINIREIVNERLTVVGVVGHGYNAHGLLGDIGPQDPQVPARVFVGPQNRPSHPVRPEDEGAINRQPEGVHRLRLQNHLKNQQSQLTIQENQSTSQ